MAQKQSINMGGKRYDFTPGKGGSLIHKGEPVKPGFNLDNNKPRMAKTIGSPQAGGGNAPRRTMAKFIYPKKKEAPEGLRLALRNGKFDYETR